MQSTQSISARIAALIDRATEWAMERRERLRTFGLIGALIVFVVGLVLAVRATPELGSELKIAPLLLLILLSAPLGTVLNTIELHALSRIAGGPMSWRTSLELTVFTSAANLMPIPGGALTKLAGMKAHGVGYGVGSAMVVLSFMVWGALAFLYSGAALALLGAMPMAATFALAGVALLTVSAFGFARFRSWRMVGIVAGMRIVSFAVDAWRFQLALIAIGVSASYLQCSVFVVVAFIGSAVVIVPQGLGVSEAAGALIATFVGISAGYGFIATAIQRVVRLVGLALIAVGFILIGRKPQSAATD